MNFFPQFYNIIKFTFAILPLIVVWISKDIVIVIEFIMQKVLPKKHYITGPCCLFEGFIVCPNLMKKSVVVEEGFLIIMHGAASHNRKPSSLIPQDMQLLIMVFI